MNLSTLVTAAIASAGIGFSVVYTVDDVAIDQRPSDRLPPAIEVSEIVLRADGSSIYDRTVLAAPVWMVWSGQVLNDDNEVVCNGGELFEYTLSHVRHEDKTVDWLIGDDCSGIEEGMRFSFTWTPVGPDYAPVRYPAEGYGIVASAD